MLFNKKENNNETDFFAEKIAEAYQALSIDKPMNITKAGTALLSIINNDFSRSSWPKDNYRKRYVKEAATLLASYNDGTQEFNQAIKVIHELFKCLKREKRL